jgi:hypothetical protein
MRPPTSVIVAGFVIALPVLVPWAIVDHYRYKHRLRSAARRIPCSVCGASLGDNALREADKLWFAHVAELHRKHPGSRLRLFRAARAVCKACGTMFAFNESSRTFTQTQQA